MGVSRTRSIFNIQGETNLGSDGGGQNPQEEAFAIVPLFPNIQELQESWPIPHTRNHADQPANSYADSTWSTDITHQEPARSPLPFSLGNTVLPGPQPVNQLPCNPVTSPQIKYYIFRLAGSSPVLTSSFNFGAPISPPFGRQLCQL